MKNLIGMPETRDVSDIDKTKWLWRYMDLSKFIYLITQKALFIPSSKLFEDKREGLMHLPKMVKLRNGLAMMLEIRDELSHQDPNTSQKNLRDVLAISCWNQSETESVALWKMYTAGFGGVCIRSNIDTVASQIVQQFPHVLHEAVSYDRLKKVNELKAFFRKTAEWEFEKEYRFIVNLADARNMEKRDSDIDTPTAVSNFISLDGLSIPVNLESLIKEIRIHYQAPKWVFENVKTLTKTFISPNIKVFNSELNDQ